MHQILIAGAGKIGVLIAHLLAESGVYEVWLLDRDFAEVERVGLSSAHLHTVQLDITDQQGLIQFIKQHPQQAIISSLPFYCNPLLAAVAQQFNCHYFDLTEDRDTVEKIRQLALKTTCAFVPQCGLAPGIVNIIAHHLMQSFSELNSAQLRVGALPVHSSNALHYSLTWSVDGLINEYCNPCEIITDGVMNHAAALENLEDIEIDGLSYEAFNTSGGLGSLAHTYQNKIKQLNYKTLRYPGHCEKMRFLLRDLRLSEKRDVLKAILEHAIPKTDQDVVLLYVAVNGQQQGEYVEQTYVRKFYAQTLAEHTWSAIQLTTAHGLCAVVDQVLSQPQRYCGFILQENFSWPEILQNRFGKFYTETKE